MGNCPGAPALSGPRDDGEWIELLPRTELLPDTRHPFLVDTKGVVHQSRLEIFSDGDVARLRLFGELA